MQRVSEFNFYDLAVHIHPLTEIAPTTKYSHIFFSWIQAREVLGRIFSQRPLTVSLSAANELYAAITEIVPERWEDAVSKATFAEDEPDIPIWQIQKIIECAKKI